MDQWPPAAGCRPPQERGQRSHPSPPRRNSSSVGACCGRRRRAEISETLQGLFLSLIQPNLVFQPSSQASQLLNREQPINKGAGVAAVDHITSRRAPQVVTAYGKLNRIPSRKFPQAPAAPAGDPTPASDNSRWPCYWRGLDRLGILLRNHAASLRSLTAPAASASMVRTASAGSN